MSNRIPEQVRDFFSLVKRYPVRLIVFGVACYAIGRWTMAAGLDLQGFPLI